MLAGKLSNLHVLCYSGIIYYVPRFTVHLLSLCIAFLFFAIIVIIVQQVFNCTRNEYVWNIVLRFVEYVEQKWLAS